jgi:GNAT superfamily N-acetyltransferase
MGELEPAAVAAANDAWVMEPEGSEVVETAEYRLVRFPERFGDPLQVQWVRSARPAAVVLDEVVARAAGFGLPEALVFAKLSAPDGFDEALLGRGAELVDTGDVLAMALPADLTAPDLAGLEVRWRTTPRAARDANTIGTTIFGGSPASDDDVARVAAADRETVDAGTGGAVVAYLDATPAGVAGLMVVDGVARLWGGAVLEPYRGLGVYRAMVAARISYAVEHGAAMAFTQARTTTSAPILQRLGFVSYGQERVYRLPLG